MKSLSWVFFISSFVLLFFISVDQTFAQVKNLPTVTVINPIRGNQLGHEHEELLPGLSAQWQATHTLGINATWLWQYSALENTQLVNYAKKEMANQEFGIFLEIDRNTADKAHVVYKGRGPWYFSDGLFLISYDVSERHKIIDTAFEKFRATFGYYPKTVGSWWIGADSLAYMQKKYGITGAMHAANQYNLDVYTMWGTPWNSTYIPSKENEGIPAASFDKSSKVVVSQWAARDPLRGYGPSGDNGTFSTQDFEIKGYDVSYFDYMISLYAQKPLDQILVGLENSPPHFFEDGQHYPTILKEIATLRDNGKIQIQLEKDYTNAFLAKKDIFAPTHTLLSKDYKTNDQSFWYVSTTYRTLIRKIGDNVYLSDLRNYANKTPEAFFLLPNSQGNLRVNTPALIDSATFPQQEILLEVSKDPLRIIEEKNVTELFSGNAKIATFFPNSLTIHTLNKSFHFVQATPSLPLFWVLFFLFLLYCVMLYATKRDKKLLLQSLLLFVPLALSIGLLSADTTTIVLDKKELLFSYLLPLFSFSLSWKMIAVFQLLPFLFLLVVHYLSTILFKKKYVFLITIAVESLLFLHLPYFPLDHSTYRIVGICFATYLLFVGLITGTVAFLTRSKKVLQALASIALFIFFAIGVALLTSRTKEILTPFELDAFQMIAIKKENVMYLFPKDVPIYKAIRPLLYDDPHFAGNLTNTHWQKIVRDAKNNLILPQHNTNILVFVPRYLGLDIPQQDLETYHLQKIYDNQEIAIFEEK